MPQLIAPTHIRRRPPSAPTELALSVARKHTKRRSFVPDHLGWWPVTDHPGEWCRLAAKDARGPQILTSPGLSAGQQTSPSHGLALPPAAKGVLPRTLYEQLAIHSPIMRLPTPTVWEAAGTAVIRQVVHRDQARVSFQKVCESLGSTVLLGGEVRYAFPTAERVISAGEGPLRAIGIGFKARTLLALAEWSLDSHEHLGPPDLYEALKRVRGVGPWTASVAVCDVCSDYGFYPVEDLAIRAYARNRWGGHPWPESPAAFAREWRAVTHPHTAEITAFMIADAILSAAPATVF